MKNIFRKSNVVVFMIFSAVVIFAFIFYTSKDYETSTAPQPSDLLNVKFTISEIFFGSNKAGDIVKKIYEIVDSSSSIKFKEPGKHRIIWITDDNWNIFDGSAAGIEMPIEVEMCDREVCVRNLNIKILNQKISEIFLLNGFKINSLNTSASEDDNRRYDYILAFEKGDTKCALITNPDLISDESLPRTSVAIHYTVACSDQIKERYNEEIPFLKASDNHAPVVIVEKIVGDFARLQVGGLWGSGMLRIVKKTDNSWRIIVETQETISCELIDKYQIPKEIYPVDIMGCYEEPDMPPVFNHLQQ